MTFDEIASQFIEKNIHLIDENKFVELFSKINALPIGALKAVRVYLDNANIEYKEQIETRLIEYTKEKLDYLFKQNPQRELPMMDFYEFYIEKCSLGYELGEFKDLLNSHSDELGIKIIIKTFYEFSEPYICKR